MKMFMVPVPIVVMVNRIKDTINIRFSSSLKDGDANDGANGVYGE